MSIIFKKYFYGLLLLSLLPLAARGAAASNPQQVFEQANQLYSQHKYDSAAQAYMQLIKEGYRNEELYYNTGNAFYKNNEIGQAIYYYEKALQEDPENEVILHNRQLAQEKVTNAPDKPPLMQLKRWGRQLMLFLPPDTWMAGSLILYIIFMGLLGLIILSSKRRRGLIWAIITLGLLAIFFFAVSYARHQQLTQHNHAIVMQNTIAHTAPDKDSRESFNLHEGFEIQLLNNVGKWEKVKLSDGKIGWINKSAYKVL